MRGIGGRELLLAGLLLRVAICPAATGAPVAAETEPTAIDLAIIAELETLQLLELVSSQEMIDDMDLLLEESQDELSTETSTPDHFSNDQPAAGSDLSSPGR